MKRFLIAVGAVVLLGLILFWQLRRVPTPPVGSGASTLSNGKQPAAAAPSPALNEEKSPKGEPRSKLADDLNTPTGTPAADLRIVANVLAAFRTNFPREGNPVGSNAEITAVLTGRNRLHLALVPPDHPAINRDGELCDRWGTPFIFHAQSGTEMEVRSAGPDKKPYTSDDVVLAPPANAALKL